MRAKASRACGAYKRFASGETLELTGFIPGNSNQIKGAPSGSEGHVGGEKP